MKFKNKRAAAAAAAAAAAGEIGQKRVTNLFKASSSSSSCFHARLFNGSLINGRTYDSYSKLLSFLFSPFFFILSLVRAPLCSRWAPYFVFNTRF